MAKEIATFLHVDKIEKLIDCTLGGGGHSEIFLESGKNIEVLGIDCDQDALDFAGKRLEKFGEKFESRRMNFSEIELLKNDEKWSTVDGILMDIGISSFQIDEATRGFSYKNDGPLDMRMDRRKSLTAAEILNHYEEIELKKIFYRYGEEKKAGKIAKKIVERRKMKNWQRTAELAELINAAYGPYRGGKAPQPARCFQALRIVVNDELENLKTALNSAFDLLENHGRLAVITFHSLEDRIVKEFFKEKQLDCICPPGLPLCNCTKMKEAELVTRKPVIAGKDEIKMNSRATSAKLRVLEKCIIGE